MKIAISNSIYTKWNDKYPTQWTDEDFYIQLGDTIDLCYDPARAINYHKNHSIGVIPTGDCEHDVNPDFDGELGFLHYINDFIVFKNDEVGRSAYEDWKTKKSITQVISDSKIQPALYPSNIIMLRTNPNAKPKIIWGTR